MDEPTLQVRDGAGVLLIPLSELLSMRRSAVELAEAVLARAPSAKETAEAVMHAATAYGPQRARANVSAYLLQDAMAVIEERKTRSAITAPAQSVGAPAPGDPPPASPGTGAPTAAPGQGPCMHPPDIACPNCAAAHQEARNAKKRAGARA